MDTVSEHASVRISITKNNYVAEEISAPAFDPSGIMTNHRTEKFQRPEP